MHNDTQQGTEPSPDVRRGATRRDVLRFGAAGAAGAVLAAGGFRSSPPHPRPPHPARRARPRPRRPGHEALVHPPGAETRIMQQGLPVGNGRLGALVTGDPSRDALYLTDATLWTGGAQRPSARDGQFPYGRNDFGLRPSRWPRPTSTSRPRPGTSPTTAAPST